MARGGSADGQLHSGISFEKARTLLADWEQSGDPALAQPLAEELGNLIGQLEPVARESEQVIGGVHLVHGDANAVGELLLWEAYPGEERGIYYNRQVRADASEWSEEQRAEFYRQLGYIDPDDNEEDEGYFRSVVARSHGYSFPLGELLVECAWFWEGDIVLNCRVWQQGTLLRSLENTDAKKNYVWRDAAQKLPQMPILPV